MCIVYDCSSNHEICRVDAAPSFKEHVDSGASRALIERLRRVIRNVKEDEATEQSAWRRIFDQTTKTLLRQVGNH